MHFSPKLGNSFLMGKVLGNFANFFGNLQKKFIETLEESPVKQHRGAINKVVRVIE